MWMFVQRLVLPTAVFLPMACTSAAEEDGELIVPESLTVTALPGGNGVLEVTALTLTKERSGTAVYAALKNDGDTPACSAAFSIELFDAAEQSMASGIAGLLTQQFYRLTDGSNAIAACVGPGDMTMAAITDLPVDLAIEDVRTVLYRCPYFALEVASIDGLSVRQLKRVAGTGGTAFSGKLVNELDVEVSNPSVTVFPVNRVGRPLGVAIGTETVDVPPGGEWAFETNAVAAPGSDFVAYPAGALAAE